MKFDLDTPIFYLDGIARKIPWTIRNSVEGCQVWGSIGSGKSSSSSRFIALNFLKAGYSGLVLTAKPDERKVWEEYCAMAGRSDDLIIVEPNGKHKFNFIDYESQGHDGKSATENIVQVLRTVIRANSQQTSGSSDDPFWESALDLLLYSLIDLCKLAYDRVTIDLMNDIALAIPTPEVIDKTLRLRAKKDRTEEEEKLLKFLLSNKLFTAIEEAEKKIITLKKKFKDTLTEEQLEYLKVTNSFESAFIDAEPGARLFEQVCQFFLMRYATLSDKTRSIVDFAFSAFLNKLLRDPIYSTFCKGESTFKPEDCFDGKIILIDYPVKVHAQAGQSCQILFKYIWQRAMERRDTLENGRPAFLFADEAQSFLHEYDAIYQATARSSRIATVYITQNLPNYFASMGGQHAEARVKSFLGTLNTEIFHANADVETNNYASQRIGDGKFKKASEGMSASGTEINTSQNTEFIFDRLVRPEYFQSLKTGGSANNCMCQAYVRCLGLKLNDGYPFTKMTFNQNYHL
jgi:type IV secretory pathway TraG/TraD family ATPase VirD4